jgi:serine/threonine-protein kinase SRPK3
VASHDIKPKDVNAVKRASEMKFDIKLCDMGNACYINRHYSDIIQTREYRSPEVMLEGQYDESADIWSLACMIFELVTGDYLFDPKKGKTYKKNDDHLALITELIGEPKDE